MDNEKQPMTAEEIEIAKAAAKQAFLRQAQYLETDYNRKRLELHERFNEELNKLEARLTEARTPDAEPGA